MYAQNQIPAILGAPPTGNPYLTSIANGWQKLVKANGLSLFPDWASATMLQTRARTSQDDGRASQPAGHGEGDPGRLDGVRQADQDAE